jgi:hypothetical protein
MPIKPEQRYIKLLQEGGGQRIRTFASEQRPIRSEAEVTSEGMYRGSVITPVLGLTPVHGIQASRLGSR